MSENLEVMMENEIFSD